MQVCYLLLAVAYRYTLISCKGVGADPTAPYVASNLRSYDMTDLNRVDSTEERTLDARKLDDLIDATKIADAMKDVTKQDKLFTAWSKSVMMSNDVLNTLAKNPAQYEKVIEAFKNHQAQVSAKADEFLKSKSKIRAAIVYNNEKELFRTWNENEAVSDAIVAKLTKTFQDDKDILLAYNQYRTNRKYGVTFHGWLRTMDLRTIVEGAKKQDSEPAKKLFREWYAKEKTVGDLRDALNNDPKMAKSLKFIVNGYDDYIKIQEKLAIRADLVKRAADEAR